MGAEGPLISFELILNDIPLTKSSPTKTKPKLELSEFMPLQRDFAFIVDRTILAADIVRAAAAAERALIAGADVFDVYEGAVIPEGKNQSPSPSPCSRAKNPDRRRDRRRRGQDHCRSDKENRRGPERISLCEPF